MSAEEEIEQYPDLNIAQMKFLLTLPDYSEDQAVRENLMDAISSNHMAPFYKSVCETLKWPLNEILYNELKSQNEKDLKELDEAIDHANENMIETEIKEAALHKANYLCRIGEKDESLQILDATYEKTVSLGYKVDNVLKRIRIGLFFLDFDVIVTNLKLADGLIMKCNDWTRLNRLNTYKGLYYLAVREFQLACDTFLKLAGTFSCYDVISHVQYISYTIYIAVLILTRPELESKVLNNADILQALSMAPPVNKYILSLYNCDYADFLLNLADIEEVFKRDMFLNPHYKYYTREMRILAYNQLLSTYCSLTLAYMAEQFGVSEEYMESELCKFIATKRINCKIDKISHIVINTTGNSRNMLHENIFKNGDLLLNKVQKLTKILDA